MDAAITNTGTEEIFIPGPNVSIPVGETKNWNDILVADLDGNTVIKDAVLAGNLSVSITPDAADAAAAAQGSLNSGGLEAYVDTDLPTGYEGRVAFCTNGRKTGEGALAGTGIPVYFSNAQWRRYYDDAQVTV
jgi:hypothetical protein